MYLEKEIKFLVVLLIALMAIFYVLPKVATEYRELRKAFLYDCYFD